MINHLVTFLATAGSLMEKSLVNLLFSNIDEFAKRLYVLIISVNLDSFSLTNHKVFIKFNKFPPPNFHSSYSYR